MRISFFQPWHPENYGVDANWSDKKRFSEASASDGERESSLAVCVGEDSVISLNNTSRRRGLSLQIHELNYLLVDETKRSS